MNLIFGATALNFLWNNIKDATIKTIIGIVDMAKANITREGGHSFVNIYITTNDKKLPITGNADDNATFW